MKNVNKETVLIYRDNLLPPSETFIKAQAENFSGFQSYYVGAKSCGENTILENEEVIIINNGNKIGRIKEVLYKFSGVSFSIKGKLLNLKPKLLHAHFGPDGVIATPLARKLNIPLIVTFHGYDATMKDDYVRGYFHKNYIKKRKELMKEASIFIAVSNFIKQKLIEQGFPRNKIIQQYIGIDTTFFTHNPVIQRERVVLFVGRLVEKKGGEYLIRAMAEVQKRNPNVKLIIIGDGPLRERLEKKAEKMLVNYNFLGAQNPLIIKEWLNKARIFCVPSITAENGDTEGFGMVFAEANSMGVPVVSFASGGIPEAVAHGETGFLAPEKDFEMLSVYIMRLLENEELWERFSRKGIERVRALYDLRINTKQLEEIYSNLIH